MTARSGAFINDVPVTGEDITSWRWGLRYGVAPVERQWLVDRATVDRLASFVGKDVTIRLQGPEVSRVYQRVTLLQVLPGPRPELLHLHLADARWRWANAYIASRYNILLTSGSRFVLNDQGLPENFLPTPNVRYQYHTLNNGLPWIPYEVLDDVFKQLGQEWFADGFLSDAADIQNLVVDARGDRAVEQVMERFPSRLVFIDKNGVARVRNPVTTYDPPVERPLAHGGMVRRVGKFGVRPSKVVVLFTREIEMRFFYTEPVNFGFVLGRDDFNTLYNVAPVPDVDLRFKLGPNNVAIGRGSYEILDNLLVAWASRGFVDLDGRPLTPALIRLHALKHGSVSIEQRWGNNPALPQNTVQLNRARTVVEHWRRTFQIDPDFRSRLESIGYHRVFVLNQYRYTRGKAEVHCDYIRRPSLLSFARHTDPNPDSGWFVRGYNLFLNDCEIAPATIVPLDEEAGIFHVLFQTSPLGTSDLTIPGYPTKGTGPSKLLGQANRFNLDAYAQWGALELESGFRLSVLLTVVPGIPNTKDRFYAVEVPPLDGPGDGPPLYVRVFPNRLTARYGWLDRLEFPYIDAIKGVQEPPVDALINKDDLQEVALGVARRIYDTYKDRQLGESIVDFANAPDAPSGSLMGIEDVVSGDGQAVTHLNYAQIPPANDFTHLLPTDVRQLILRIFNDQVVR